MASDPLLLVIVLLGCEPGLPGDLCTVDEGFTSGSSSSVDDEWVDCPIDADGDGYAGDLTESTSATDCPDDVLSGDCNDENPTVNPGAEDLCTEPTDYDCDGESSYADEDSDDAPACLDCDDSDSDNSPYNEEDCEDERDNDCDEHVDYGDTADCFG